jgi:hypothetical protein
MNKPSTGVRIAKLVGIMFALSLSLGVAQMAASGMGVPPEQLATSVPVALAWIAAFGLLARMGTQVGYRYVDALLLFVPVVSTYYVCKVLWRATALETRYWERPVTCQV